MKTDAFLQCRIPTAIKQTFKLVAARRQLTESALLKCLVDSMLQTAGIAASTTDPPAAHQPRDSRLQLRISAPDRRLLAERAARRGMAAATYASMQLRAHLRAQAPVPAGEVKAIRQATRELAAIGRNLNQLARVANAGDRSGQGVSQRELLSILRACEGLRDHIRDYIQSNLKSWEGGDASA